MLISIGLYQLMDIISRRIKSLPTFILAMKIGIMVVGSYGAYTLGANNVANTTGALLEPGYLLLF